MDKMKIRQYKIEKVEVDSKEIELPTEPLYFFETGVRRSIRIVPKVTTWNMEHHNQPEYIYEFQVTAVYRSMECKIEMISLSVLSLEETYHRDARTLYNSAAKLIVDRDGNERTKEQFDADLQAAFDKINGIDS